MTGRTRRLGAGLTALEVAVIVVVVAIVGAILFPSFTNCGPRGNGTHCISNLKQLATGSMIYTADWDERLMDRDSWMDAIVPYRKSPDNEHCPAVQELEKNPSLYGYAFNSKLSRADSTKFKEPDKVEMLYESVNLGRNASDPVTSLPNPPRLHTSSRRNTVAYLDTHVRALLPPAKP